MLVPINTPLIQPASEGCSPFSQEEMKRSFMWGLLIGFVECSQTVEGPISITRLSG